VSSYKRGNNEVIEKRFSDLERCDDGGGVSKLRDDGNNNGGS